MLNLWNFTEAEEKVKTMEDEYKIVKQREHSLTEEVDRLKKRISFYESKIQHSSYLKKNKGKIVYFSIYLAISELFWINYD